jgi:hypothetical protein
MIHDSCLDATKSTAGAYPFGTAGNPFGTTGAYPFGTTGAYPFGNG